MVKSGSTRKCDTTKYRRRRQKQQAAHKAHSERLQEIERERMARIRWEQERHRELRMTFLLQEKRLVQVLANHLYQISPEHAARARVRELMRITREIGEWF